MKQIVKVFLVLIYLSVYCATNSQASDFIEKDLFYSPRENIKKILTIQNEKELLKSQKIEQHWEKYKPSQIQKLDSPTIPKIIHQIWLGPQPLPPRFAAYAQECKALHPKWEYKLWTDKEVESFDFPTKDIYQNSRSYAEKADILRAEILYQYGGLYLDTDILCFKPFDEILDYYDFFAGPSGFVSRKSLTIQNALTGAKPHHPILRIVADKSRQFQAVRTPRFENQKYQNILQGQSHWFGMAQEQWHKFSSPEIAMSRVFFNFNDTVYETILENTSENNKRLMVFPLDYFFPVYNNFKRMGNGLWNDSNKYSFCIHDYFKNMRFIKFLPFEFAADISQQVMKHYMLKQKYVKFQYYDYRLNTIPKTMHFVNMSANELDAKWKEGVYRTWQQKFWNKDDIYSIADKTEKSLLNRTNSPKAFELLSGLIILNKFGGVYLDNKAEPGQENFLDLIYSLDFFAGLTKMETQTPTASYKAIGVKPQHEITTRILEQLDQENGEISLATLQDTILQKGYEYINIDGKNTFLPQQYFEPTEDQKYSILK